MEPLIHLNYKVDKKTLLAEALANQNNAVAYTDNRYPDMKLDDWLIGHYNSQSIVKIMNDLEVTGKPRFYYLQPNAIIPEHTDNGTKCSINIILTEHAAPITFGDKDYYYDIILLNTTLPHSVTNNEHERIMLKISIFDESYESVAARIKYRD
jgi:hypothetical protein